MRLQRLCAGVGPTALICGGSGTNATGYFYNIKTGDIFTIADTAGNVRPYTRQRPYNFGPTNYFQRPQTTYGFNVFAHYDVFPNVRVYGEFDFSSNTTNAQIAPGGEFFGKPFTFNNANPLLSQSFKDAMGITATSVPDRYTSGAATSRAGAASTTSRSRTIATCCGAKGDPVRQQVELQLLVAVG